MNSVKTLSNKELSEIYELMNGLPEPCKMQPVYFRLTLRNICRVLKLMWIDKSIKRFHLRKLNRGENK